jgi:hypothetical protein
MEAEWTMFEVTDSQGRQVLVNMDRIVKVLLLPEKDDARTQLSLYFDGENRILLQGAEARRIWGLLTEASKKQTGESTN